MPGYLNSQIKIRQYKTMHALNKGDNSTKDITENYLTVKKKKGIKQIRAKRPTQERHGHPGYNGTTFIKETRR